MIPTPPLPPTLPLFLRILLYPTLLLFGFLGIALAVVIIMVVMAWPNLPSIAAATDYRPKVPLRVFTADGYLMGEFGEERREVVQIEEVPPLMKNAILAAEDRLFYQHAGINYMSILRALSSNVLSGEKQQGASTITQQVVRNFFLTNEKTYTRKLYEALLSFKIENTLSKDQIFELYINQIFLGQRAYGFSAAAQIYFGKPLRKISVAEAAMLAGLPKAPSAYNPIANPKRARVRQQYVLQRMLELDFIDKAQYDAALEEPLIIKRELANYPVHAEYAAEMARQLAEDTFRDEVYTRGIKVYTTIIKDEQEAAYRALRKGVLDYDRRHGYRGAESTLDMSDIDSDQEEAIDIALQEIPSADDLVPALVLDASLQQIKVYRKGGDVMVLRGDALKFPVKFLGEQAPPNKRLRRGAIIRLQQDEKGLWQVSQLPEAEAAFIAMDPQEGSVRALVGGFDFNRNKFNHVTQAWRQPGSSFKPFIYSAAVEKGFTANSIVSDDPIVIPAAETGSQAWQPKNYDGKYEGPMALRTALAKSKNMVSIRLLQNIGTQYTQDFITRFGFDAQKHPPYLTMALGAGSVTPWQMVNAYSVFANGGFLITPYIVREIVDEKNTTLAHTTNVPAGDESLRVIDARNAFIMDVMMRDVATYGTAARTSGTLKRRDLSGKTGTTNEYIDAWFCGYQMTRVGCAWMGFDQPKKLGNKETGGVASMPMWIAYMSEALRNVPQQTMLQPKGLVIRGDGRDRDFVYAENASEPTLRLVDEVENLLMDLQEEKQNSPPADDVSTTKAPVPTPTATQTPNRPPSPAKPQPASPFVLQPGGGF